MRDNTNREDDDDVLGMSYSTGQILWIVSINSPDRDFIRSVNVPLSSSSSKSIIQYPTMMMI